MLSRTQEDNLLVGLDVGSSKTCAVAARCGGNESEIVAWAVKATKGIKKGAIIDIEGISHSIRSVIEEIEYSISSPVEVVFLTITGSNIRIIDSSGSVAVRKGDITEAEISKAIESAAFIGNNTSLDPLHVVPYEFIVDGTRGIRRPVGMSGARLEARVGIVAADAKLVQNFVRGCEMAGIGVDAIILQSLASSESTLTEDERDKGVALIDIGGGKTSIAVFKEGVIRHSSFLPIGGNHYTSDLAILLKLSFNEAERIKKVYTAIPENNYLELEAIGMDGNLKGIPLSEIDAILSARSEELLMLIKNEIDKCRLEEPLLEAVITGGGSQMSGLNQMAETILGLPVRTGFVNLGREYGGDSSKRLVSKIAGRDIMNPEYTTAVGALIYGMEMVFTERQGGLFSRFLKRLKRLFRRT